MKISINTELRHLYYVVAAAECGSFRRAGLALNTRESSISRRVRDIENQLGTALFNRSSTGVCLTPAGSRFLHQVRAALQYIDDGAKDVAAIARSEDGFVKVGIFSSLASGFLFELLRAYKRAHAGVTVELIDSDPMEHVAAVRQLRLDVAFVAGTAVCPDCETEHFWSEKIYAVLPSEHRLAGKDVVQWRDLAEEKFIVSDAASGQQMRSFLVQRLATLGHYPEVQGQLVGRDNLLSMVAVGRGLTLTSESTTAARFPGTTYRPITDEVLPFCAIWSPRNDNPACRQLLGIARAMARSRISCSQSEILERFD